MPDPPPPFTADPAYPCARHLVTGPIARNPRGELRIPGFGVVSHNWNSADVDQIWQPLTGPNSVIKVYGSDRTDPTFWARMVKCDPGDDWCATRPILGIDQSATFTEALAAATAPASHPLPAIVHVPFGLTMFGAHVEEPDTLVYHCEGICPQCRSLGPDGDACQHCQYYNSLDANYSIGRYG